MKKILLLFFMFLSSSVQAKEAPDKFRNPIFNDTLWTSNMNLAHNMKVTPTYIDELDYPYYSTCEYLTEDDKGILLKCHPSYMRDGYTNYNMLYVRYKYNKTCSVWLCLFEIDEGEVKAMGMGTPSALSSNVFNCEDEEKEPLSIEPLEPMNCMEELKARGWEKYIQKDLPVEK